jgi:hypothetical protein
MGGNREKAGSGTHGKGSAEGRKVRLAEALRANLKRRKQASGRRPKPGKDGKTGGGGDTAG